VRLIGHIKESSHAAAFGDFLSLEGIENDVEREDDGTYSVWAHDEEEFEKATQLLSEFQKNPDEPKYHGLEGKVRKLRAESEREAETKKPVMHDGRDTMDARRHGIGQLTLALIVFSVFIFLLSDRGTDPDSIMFMFIKEFVIDRSGMMTWNTTRDLPEVRAGQVWRLITPIFVHFGFLHILFNMMWLRQLGSAMEHIQGRLFLGTFILVTAAASNFVQHFFTGYPLFGGMSGVVFALFGYVWMKTKFDFMSGYTIDKQSVTLMLVWFVICFTGIIRIANGAHAGGLAIGVAWGYASARGYFLKRK
jgi:GlpG protein